MLPTDEETWRDVPGAPANGQFMISLDYIKSILDYDQNSGVFTWKIRPEGHFKNKSSCKTWNTKNANKPAGSNEKGYVALKIDGKKYKAHRVAWFYVNGEWPEIDLDHKNRNRNDNRIDNLRKANDKQNQHNRGIQKNNTSGCKGVAWHKKTSKWQVSFRHDGKHFYVGLFECKELANAIYEEYVEKLRGQFCPK